MVEDMVVRDGDARGFQAGDGANDTRRAKVAVRVVVLADDQDTEVVALNGHHEVMEVLKILIIVCQQDAIIKHCMSQVDRVLRPRQANVGRDSHVMSRSAQERDE